ncbi:MAG: GntR family transcriptional regulator [Bryobacteraceae bacterium]
MPVFTEHNFSESAYRRLLEAILSGRMPPGSPLSRRRLAEEFGMSPVPVGEALTRLEAEGLVETRPRAGSRVRIPCADDILGNYELREALETHSARLFAEFASPAFERRVTIAAERLDAAFGELNGRYSRARHARVERLHTSFHMLVAQATRCSVLVDAIARSRVLLFNWLFTVSAELGSLPADWHRQLARALVEGTPEQASDAMRAHVRYRRKEVLEKLQSAVRAPAPRQPMSRGPQRRTMPAAKGSQ